MLPQALKYLQAVLTSYNWNKTKLQSSLQKAQAGWLFFLSLEKVCYFVNQHRDEKK